MQSYAIWPEHNCRWWRCFLNLYHLVCTVSCHCICYNLIPVSVSIQSPVGFRTFDLKAFAYRTAVSACVFVCICSSHKTGKTYAVFLFLHSTSPGTSDIHRAVNWKNIQKHKLNVHFSFFCFSNCVSFVIHIFFYFNWALHWLGISYLEYQ